MQVKECSQCGGQNNLTALYCNNCSQSLKDAPIVETLPEKSSFYRGKGAEPLKFPLICPECGVTVVKKTFYCPECQMILTKGRTGDQESQVSKLEVFMNYAAIAGLIGVIILFAAVLIFGIPNPRRTVGQIRLIYVATDDTTYRVAEESGGKTGIRGLRMRLYFELPISLMEQYDRKKASHLPSFQVIFPKTLEKVAAANAELVFDRFSGKDDAENICFYDLNLHGSRLSKVELRRLKAEAPRITVKVFLDKKFVKSLTWDVKKSFQPAL